MEKSQYELCVEVLRRLDNAGVLKDVVLVGSWCTLFYKDFFGTTHYREALIDKGQDDSIRKAFGSMPRRWQGKVKKQLAEPLDTKVMDVLTHGT